MRHQIASELRKLTSTRSVYAMLAGLVVLVAIGVVAVGEGAKASILAVPLDDQTFLHITLTIAPVFALLLGLRSFTDEFRFGSIVPTLLVSPKRLRVLGAKLVAVAVGGAVMSLAALAGSIVTGFGVLVAHGVHIDWSAAGMAPVVGRLLLATALWTSIGVGAGLAVKQQVAAIAGALVWLLAGEGILGNLIPHVAKYFPGSVGEGVVGIGSNFLSPGVAALVLAGYAVIAVGTGAVLMARRDVT
jgi:ABC-type transport system involved in multi-copper enzyme maturation permease subunit